MPNRIVREGILTSPKVNALSIGAEVLYRRLLSVVDDYGRYHGSVVTLRGACWPTKPEKISEKDVTKWLTELVRGAEPLLRTYNVSGDVYIEVQNFGQITRSKSKFPPPPWSKPASNLQADCVHSESKSPAGCEQNVSTMRSALVVSRSANAETVRVLHLTRPLDEWVDRLYARHPKKKNHALIGAALLKLLEKSDSADALMAEIDRVHALWCQTEDWNDKNARFCPKLDEWIGDRGFTTRPASRDPPALPPAKRWIEPTLEEVK